MAAGVWNITFGGEVDSYRSFTVVLSQSTVTSTSTVTVTSTPVQNQSMLLLFTVPKDSRLRHLHGHRL